MSRAQLIWALFAWLGIPVLYAACVLSISLTSRSQGVLLLITLCFVACGTIAIARGQRPRRSWVVLLYPFPMFFILVFIVTAMVLLGPRAV